MVSTCTARPRPESARAWHRRAPRLQGGHVVELALDNLALRIREHHAHDLQVQLLNQRPLTQLEPHVGRGDQVGAARPRGVGALKPGVRHERVAHLVEGVAELRELSMEPLAHLALGHDAMPRPQALLDELRRRIRLEPRGVIAWRVREERVHVALTLGHVVRRSHVQREIERRDRHCEPKEFESVVNTRNHSAEQKAAARPREARVEVI